MLIGCIITYNDWPLIQSCIESIYNKVDKIICIDGKYKDFPGEDWQSTDGTIYYIDSIDKAELIQTKGLTEVQKRNLYLAECKDGDTILNLDADEVLVGKIPKLQSDFGIINLYDRKRKQDRATRFFKYREGMQYKNVHYTLYYKDKMVNNLKRIVHPGFSFEYIKDFRLDHNWHLRTDTRKHYKSLYYKKLIRSEAGFKR